VPAPSETRWHEIGCERTVGLIASLLCVVRGAATLLPGGAADQGDALARSRRVWRTLAA
jgi:hypothetical protein